MIIAAEPDGFLSWDYFLKTEENQAYWEKKWTSEQCDVLINGELHQVKKHGVASDKWSLMQNGATLATAEKPSLFRQRFEVKSSSGMLVLQRIYDLRKSFEIHRGDDLVGTISANGQVTRKATIELSVEDIDFRTAVFLFWLVLISWRR